MSDSKEKKFDNYQSAAIEIDQNAVVSAGAGSGKTTVLSNRFLHLIEKYNYNVEEILTLTFTKKATTEMSDRIYKVLKTKNPQKAKDFYKANIKTIDSYCNSIAKLGCHFYGISPNFTQDNKIKDLAQEKALQLVLDNKDNVAIKNLVKSLDYDIVAKEVFVDPIFELSPIAEPIDFYKLTDKQNQLILETWNNTSKKTDEIIHQLTNVTNELCNTKKTITLEKLKTILIDNEIIYAPTLTLEDIQNSNYNKLMPYINFISSLSDTQMSKMKNEEIIFIGTQIKNAKSTFTDILNFVYNYHLLLQLLPLLTQFRQTVDNLKRSTGFLTFNDISNLAFCILRDYPQIRQIEKQKYKQIMIDEFQDNNLFQKNLLFMLAEKPERMEKEIPQVQDLCPNKLFFVGDEKQSIYLFRGADVSVFNDLSNEFKDGNLPMYTNYRSKPSLIAAFNTIFGGKEFSFTPNPNITLPCVFYTQKQKQQNQDIPSHEAIYKDVTLPKEADTSKLDKLIHFALYDQNQIQDSNQYNYYTDLEAEAYYICTKIKDLINQGVSPNDIAILFRTKTNLSVIEKFLLDFSIPYISENLNNILKDAPVNDIICLIRLIVHPKDKIIFFEYLTSPLVNFSLEEAQLIISKIVTSNITEFFCEQILSYLQEIDEQNKTNLLLNFTKAKKIYEDMLELSKKDSIAKLISTIWYDFGYRYETSWNTKVQIYASHYDSIYEIAHQCDLENSNLSTFLEKIETLKNAKDTPNILYENAEGVNLLTIHSSKGLEFDYVFICQTETRNNGDKNDKKVHFNLKYGLGFNFKPLLTNTSKETKSNFIFSLLKEENEKRELSELRRLAYVAITRAKKEVYITAVIKASNKDDKKDPNDYLPGGKKDPKSFYKIFIPIISFYKDNPSFACPFTLEEIPPAKRVTNISSINDNKTLNKLIESIQKNEYYENTKIIHYEEPPYIYKLPSSLELSQEEQIQEITSQEIPFSNITTLFTDKFTQTNFGTIAHAYLEAVINKEKPKYSNKEIIGLEKNTKAVLQVEQACTKMAQDFSLSSLGKNAVNSTWHKAEYEFRSSCGKYIIKGVIDLVFKNNVDTYTIVDYKTNQIINPSEYYLQIACYKNAISQMLNINTSKIKCFLYYLRYAKAVDITDECSKIDVEEILNK